MYSLLNDYSEITHEKIFENLQNHLRECNVGYGMDPHCANAREKIGAYLNNPDADIHFLMAGTPTNALGVAVALRPHEAVISCDSGHVNVHETGAIEATGHKVVTRPHVDGKLTPDAILSILEEHEDEHMVKPKLVYISNTTEYGTVYKLEELKELYALCQEKDLYLFLDGARLGSALTSKDNDITLADLTKYTDMFYIGGTKNGALVGEAMVVTHEDLKKDFRYIMKNQGNMMAKGFVLGMQFETLFTDDLFFDLAKHANEKAMELAEILKEYGVEFYAKPQSNQLFPWLPVELVKKMQKEFLFNAMNIEGDRQMVRLVTSCNPDETVDAFRNL